MTPSNPNPDPDRIDTQMQRDDAQLALLRRLLDGGLHENVAGLANRVDVFERKIGTQASTAEFLAESLPAAIERASGPQSHAAFAAVMAPPWINAARYAAEHKLPAATAALAPIVLPAISQAVKERLATFSLAMRRASPMRRIAWKIESLQSGLPLETVIEQDLDPFRVHRVLAVEVPSGNLMASHRFAEDGADDQRTAADSEDEAFATAALLTALRGFVRDARIGNSAAELTSIDVGNRTLHIAQQGKTMVAVEASGQLAHDLEPSLHADLFPALRSAKTDLARQDAIANWRTNAPTPGDDHGLSVVWVLAVVFFGLLFSLWWAQRWIERNDITRTRERIEAISGVASVSVASVNGVWLFNVAADPLADIAPAFDVSLTANNRILTRLDPILSLDPTIVARAVRRDLAPPLGTTLTITRDSIVVAGQPSDDYVAALKAHPRVQVAGMAVRVAAAGARIGIAPEIGVK